ncbi:MAG TPA: DUF2071 domain-containing protein [Gemmatimonadaceae bacterium]
MARDAVPRPFLSARWTCLVMLNYEASPALLAPLVPRGTELDDWGGITYVSIVGLRFLDTRVMGVAVPLHRRFEEVNLRFYVRRRAGGEWRRGVVFIREIVRLRAVATVARLAYNEPYVALPMRHTVSFADDAATEPARVEYEWRQGGAWNRLGARAGGAAMTAAEGSEAEFITEHYWGYTRRRDGGSIEYRVEHPRWRVWPAAESWLDADVARLYGPSFAEVLAPPPRSAFLADGSAVRVMAPVGLL